MVKFNILEYGNRYYFNRFYLVTWIQERSKNNLIENQSIRKVTLKGVKNERKLTK